MTEWIWGGGLISVREEQIINWPFFVVVVVAAAIIVAIESWSNVAIQPSMCLKSVIPRMFKPFQFLLFPIAWMCE